MPFSSLKSCRKTRTPAPITSRTAGRFEGPRNRSHVVWGASAQPGPVLLPQIPCLSCLKHAHREPVCAVNTQPFLKPCLGPHA